MSEKVYPESPSMIITRKDVADILDVDEKTLIYYLYRYTNETGNSLYKTYSIVKRTGGKRIIAAPIEQLKYLQLKVKKYLETIYKPREYIFGFVNGRNIVGNAQKHVNTRFILNIDIENYFNTIKFWRVRGALIGQPYCMGKEAATVIAQIACMNSCLPQGSPCSPIIANIVSAPLDTALFRVAKKHKLYYSRYADDITFSCRQSEFPKEVAYKTDGCVVVGKDLRNALDKAGFVINANKTRLLNRNQRMTVTGLTVNRRVNVTKEYIKLIRSMLNHVKHDGLDMASKRYVDCANKGYRVKHSMRTPDANVRNEIYVNVITSKIEYIGMVKGKKDCTYVKYAHELNKSIGREVIGGIKYADRIEELKKYIYLIRTESGQGTGFYVRNVGIVTCYHCITDVHRNDGRADFYGLNGDGVVVPKRRFTKDDIIACDAVKDYAVFKYDENESMSGFICSDAYEARGIIGNEVTIFGFPGTGTMDRLLQQNYNAVDVIDDYLGCELIAVSGNIRHGFSGGPVLNKSREVIGVVRAGCDQDDGCSLSLESGFIRIQHIIDRLKSKASRLD